MNEDVFAGQWKQMRGELKAWWGKLTAKLATDLTALIRSYPVQILLIGVGVGYWLARRTR